MTRRRRSRRKGRSGTGRFLEGMAVLILILVVLTFGISIASRYHGPTPTRDGVELSPEDGVGSEAGRELHISGPPRPVVTPPTDRPEVEIANGCGVAGLAQDLRFVLHGPEFDVVDTGNADHYDYVETVVVAAEADRDAAESVARFLQRRYGVGKVVVVPKRPSSLADVRVVIGTDLAAIVENEEAAGTARIPRDD